MTIREAYEASNMTIKEIAECLQVPQRTLQDWIYGKRNPKDKTVADKIMAMSILTKEGRQCLIIEEQNWEAAMNQYKIDQCSRLSKIGSFGGAFSEVFSRIPSSVKEALTAEQLAELIDAMHQAYQDGRKAGKAERE